jgi:peroxiredoxin
LGASLIAISPQLPVYSRELIERRHLTFEILSDPGNEVAARFGLRWTLPNYLREVYRSFPLDLEKFNGDASWTLSIPARFVIYQNGIIRAVQSDPDYTTRPEPTDSLDVLRALR